MVNTVKTTNNFWDALVLKISKDRKTIKFRNGVETQADYGQYALLRDWFADLRKKAFTVKKLNCGYLIRNGSNIPEFSFQTQSILTAKPFFDLLLTLTSNGWSVERIGCQYKVQKGTSKCIIEQISAELFSIKNGKVEIIGPRESLYVHLYESEAGLYQYDYAGTTVLDIGGFCGETAAYFSSEGATKVIVYEPVQAHQDIIKKNIQLNNCNVELHNMGIGEDDGALSVHYDSLGLGFGLSNSGQNQTTIKTRNVSEVILQSKADVAKIDCEGAETSLLKVSPEILGLIGFYFIETHSHEIEEAIVNKFYASGFMMAREPVKLSKDIAMHYFKKLKDSAS